MKKHPLELYKFREIVDNDYIVEPEALFQDEDGHHTAMEFEQLEKTIEHCRKYGFDRDCFEEAMKQLTPHHKIFINIKDEDIIPIQR